MDEYLSACGISDDKAAPLFRTAFGKTGQLTDHRMNRTDALCMIWRQARAAGIETELGCHSFRATGITVYLQNGGLLENAQQMASDGKRSHQQALRPSERQSDARPGRTDCAVICRFTFRLFAALADSERSPVAVLDIQELKIGFHCLVELTGRGEGKGCSWAAGVTIVGHPACSSVFCSSLAAAGNSTSVSSREAAQRMILSVPCFVSPKFTEMVRIVVSFDTDDLPSALDSRQR